MLLEVVQHSWDAGQRVEHSLLRTRRDGVQHVEEVMVEGGEGDPTAQREFQPVLDAADWCVGVACIQGWVVKDTTCRHHTYKGSPLTHGHTPAPPLCGSQTQACQLKVFP